MNLGTQVDLRNDEATLLKLAKRKEKPISNTIGKNLATVSLNQIKNLFKRLNINKPSILSGISGSQKFSLNFCKIKKE